MPDCGGQECFIGPERLIVELREVPMASLEIMDLLRKRLLTVQNDHAR